MQKEDHHLTDEVAIRGLRPFGTSIFTEMSVLANKHGAVNLSQGFPDFDGPGSIREKAAEALVRGPNQYVLSYGIPVFREAVARKMKRFYGLNVDPDTEITVTSGATEALAATLLGIVETGDEVLLLEPSYDAYAPVAVMAGAKIRYVSLTPPDFSLPREKLAEAFNRNTKAIVINNPQNPCCKTYNREELSFIGELCKKYDAYAIGDEVYEHLVYDGRKHLSLLQVPELENRCFVVSSTAKTFSMTGWKIGYVIAAPNLTNAVRMSHQFITFCGQGPLQEAMAFAIDFPDSYYHDLLADYTKKRDRLFDALMQLGLSVFPTAGTYYLLVDIRSWGYDDDVSFCRMLTEKGGVAAIPCSCFWNNRSRGKELVRFCFCKKDETLEEAINRLSAFFGRR
ncbi:aminotransferase, class I/II [delta proteobacterium NaphS2]|nr:aminotransferase, class I/II [delta proteobacterium NaphS2]